MFERYILCDKEAVQTEDVHDWLTQMNPVDRIVEQTELGFVVVSTVFLGQNHASSGPPLLFETRVFEGKYDNHVKKYCTWNEAVKGHSEICEMILKA